MDEIEQRLADVNRRLEARRAAVRERLETRPELSHLLEGLKATFGPIRVTYLAIDDWEEGNELPRGFIPHPYRAPRVGRKGRMAELREREAPEP
jgi:hypothetical protein